MFGFFKKKEKIDRPEYRIRPTSDGRYFLERWDSVLGYMVKDTVKDEKEAEQAIKNLSRPTKYFEEPSK